MVAMKNSWIYNYTHSHSAFADSATTMEFYSHEDTVERELDNFDLKDIENYLRKKKLKNIDKKYR